MNQNLSKIVLVLLLIIAGNVVAQNQERSEQPDKYKWNLKDLFESNEAFLTELQEVQDWIPEMVKFKGKLGESASNLYTGLELSSDISKAYARLVVYANRQSDQDLRDSDNMTLKQKAQNLGNRLSESLAFLEPEILTIDAAKIDQFKKDEPGLTKYDFYLSGLSRQKAHTLSEKEEEILASAGMLTQTPVDMFNIFDNAEKPNPKVTLSNGEEVELSAAGYVKYRTTPNREDRARVFEAQFEGYKNFINMFGANLSGKVRGDYFYAKNRKYNSSLEYSLDEYNIPTGVYENLIKQIHNNLPTLHKALELKKKLLGVDKLHYYDLYMPLVERVELPFTVEEGQETVKNALAPMGDEYLATLQKAFDDKWIDYLPARGKRSGAYSSGSAYDVHPYILHNWLDDYESVSTLAHELGHSLHSFYTNKSQPYVYTDYSTFIAEIASTLNENLLNDYMIKNAKNDEEKLYILGSYLELLRTTIFRQVSFAEFEWEIHKRIENGEPLTGEKMSEIYYDIVKTYYGHDKGVCIVDDYVQYEWAYIPHFLNYTFYVYQYSTSLIYSTAFAEKIINEGEPAVDKFLNLLKGGSSDYPIELLKKAGLDPLSNEAFDLTMKRMNEVIVQIEELTAKK